MSDFQIPYVYCDSSSSITIPRGFIVFEGEKNNLSTFMTNVESAAKHLGMPVIKLDCKSLIKYSLSNNDEIFIINDPDYSDYNLISNFAVKHNVYVIITITDSSILSLSRYLRTIEQSSLYIVFRSQTPHKIIKNRSGVLGFINAI